MFAILVCLPWHNIDKTESSTLIIMPSFLNSSSLLAVKHRIGSDGNRLQLPIAALSGELIQAAINF
jgi:hypothetical protein